MRRERIRRTPGHGSLRGACRNATRGFAAADGPEQGRTNSRIIDAPALIIRWRFFLVPRSGELWAAFLEAIGRALGDVQFVLFPGLKTAFEFHHGKALAGEAGAGIGGEVTLLGVAINHVGLVLA